MALTDNTGRQHHKDQANSQTLVVFSIYFLAVHLLADTFANTVPILWSVPKEKTQSPDLLNASMKVAIQLPFFSSWFFSRSRRCCSLSTGFVSQLATHLRILGPTLQQEVAPPHHRQSDTIYERY